MGKAKDYVASVTNVAFYKLLYALNFRNATFIGRSQPFIPIVGEYHHHIKEQATSGSLIRRTRDA